MLFQQTLSETFLPHAQIIALLQRLLSRHLTAKDIIEGSTTLRDPFHNPLFETRREIVDGGVSITVGENPRQTPEAFGKLQKAEIEKWWPIIKADGITAE